MTPLDKSEDEDVNGLLSAAQEPMELGFAVDVLTKMEDDSECGRWPDLTRLEARRPDILAGIVWFLVRRVPVPSICEALKVSPCTVNAVRHHPKWKEAVVSKSETLAGQIDEILSLKVEHVLDEAKQGKLPSAFDMKLLFEIRQLLTGGATARVEHQHSPEEEETLRFFQAARQAALPASAMVFKAEILPQLGGSDQVLIQPDNTVQKNANRETGDS